MSGRLPDLPIGLHHPAAASWHGRVYVIGGYRHDGGRARALLVLRGGNWRFGPRLPAERAAAGAAVGGRTSGFASNLRRFERFLPGPRRWERLPPVPRPRGGTGAAALSGSIVSVGGEATEGTIRFVYGYSVAARRWRRLPDLPTPRHGLAVAALGGRVYAIGGGTVPGFSVSTANESLALHAP
jgi:N-acetylneuraminic acid mutarotase